MKQPDDDQESVGRSRIALASSSLRWSSSCGDTGSEVGELRPGVGIDQVVVVALSVDLCGEMPGEGSSVVETKATDPLLVLDAWSGHSVGS